MKEDGEEYVSHRGRWRGRQPRRKMERKTSTPGEDGEEDISHGGRWRGRHQPWRKASAMMEDGEEDISNDGRWRGTHQPRRKMERKTSVSKEDGEEDISHGGRWRGRHQPRRKMERKRAAASRRSEDCPSRPAPFSTAGKRQNVHFVFSPLSMHVYANSVTVFSCIMTDKSIVTTLHVLNSSYDVFLSLTPHPPFQHPSAPVSSRPSTAW